MIGVALIKKCISEGVNVLALINPESSRKGNVPNHPLVKVFECSLCEICQKSDQIKTIVNTEKEDLPYDAFYHLGWAATSHAGRMEVYPHIENITYTLDAVRLAHECGCRRFIGAGSQAEYGRTEGALNSDTPTFPETPYGIAKLCAGQMSHVLCDQLGLEHIWTRILSVYGPGDGENTLVSSLIRSLKTGKHFSATAAEQIWDYLFVDDAAEALYLIGERGKASHIYPVASGESRPLKAYMEIIHDIVAPDEIIGYGERPYSEGQVMHLEADISELTADTGFVPHTDFSVGIKNTYEYICDNLEENK